MITIYPEDKNEMDDLIKSLEEFSEAKYIEKGIGWLLKTCSKYKPEVIIEYLSKNKKKLSRLILRYASEKLPKGAWKISQLCELPGLIEKINA